MTNWSKRVLKAEVRASQVDAPGPARNALFLPGWDTENDTGAICVAEAISSGVIGPHTRLIVAEMVPAFVAPIEGRLYELGLGDRFRMHPHALAAPPLRFYEDEPLDYVFLDLMGCLNRDTSLWMAQHLIPRLAPGATISLTVRYNLRNDGLVRAVRAEMLREGSPYREHARFAAQNYCIDDINILTHLLMMMSILEGWTFEYEPAVFYKDGINPMVAFKFMNCRPMTASVPWPSIYDLMRLPRPEPLPPLLRPIHPAPSAPPRAPAVQGSSSVKNLDLYHALGNIDLSDSRYTPQQKDVILDLAHVLRKQLAPVGATATAPKAAPVSSVRKPQNRHSARAVKAWETRRANGWVHPRSRVGSN